MQNCTCGAERRQYWLWKDDNGVMHASSFKPTAGGVRPVLAVNARDALQPISGGRTPKHAVTAVDDPSVSWDGRCAAVEAAV